MTTQSATGHAVRAASTADSAAVADALAAAFESDPVFGWLLPDDASRLERLRRFFAIEARHVALEHEQSVVAVRDGRTEGTALALPPGRWRTPVKVQVLHGPAVGRIFGRRMPRALAFLTRLEARHPRDRHLYFPFIGVVPEAQGRGVGTTMLTPVLERCDADGLPAYLEASNPDCARLYRRLGFETLETFSALGSPPLELMRREPRQ